MSRRQRYICFHKVGYRNYCAAVADCKIFRQLGSMSTATSQSAGLARRLTICVWERSRLSTNMVDKPYGRVSEMFLPSPPQQKTPTHSRGFMRESSLRSDGFASPHEVDTEEAEAE